MIVTLVLALLLSRGQLTEKNSQPLVSATDPAYLSCTVWTGKEWTKPTSRLARTPMLSSLKGFRAYGEVKVEVDGDGSCDNTTTLYVASGEAAQFKVVPLKSANSSDGNGIRLVGWSPSGEKLLLEVTLWKYETDLGIDHVAVIYNAATQTVNEDLKLDEALRQYFGPNCEFELAVTGWRQNEDLLVKISKTPESYEYEQHFCVNKPRILVYDIREGIIKPRPYPYKAR